MYDGALVARLSFVDRSSGAQVGFSPRGAVAARDGRFIRFTPGTARAFANRFVDAGFVPRGGDSFALHDVERAATFVKDVVGTWTTSSYSSTTPWLPSQPARPPSMSRFPRVRPRGEGERDWFELNVDVFVGDGGDALTPKELSALLQSSGRYAEVRGKLFDVESLRQRKTLLAELSDRRRTGMRRSSRCTTKFTKRSAMSRCPKKSSAYAIAFAISAASKRLNRRRRSPTRCADIKSAASISCTISRRSGSAAFSPTKMGLARRSR